MRFPYFLCFVAACGSSPLPPGPATETVPVPSDGVPTSPPAASDARSYVVHEWGLVDVAPGGRIEVAAGPGHPEPPDSGGGMVRKPVLYFHRESPEPFTISVRARIPRGEIYEHWPSGTVSGETVTWASVRLDDAVCPPIVSVQRESSAPRDPESDRSPSRFPRRPRCGTPDSVCEVRELARYVTEDATCLAVENVPARLLFYRGVVPEVTLPIALAPDPRGRVAVFGATSRSSDVGPLFWYSRISTTEFRVSRGQSPASGATTMLEAPSARVDYATESRTLAALVHARGLTEQEARVFAEAWAPSLFGPESVDQDAIVYVLPEVTVDAIAELELVPPPREIRRVMLVRVPRTPSR